MNTVMISTSQRNMTNLETENSLLIRHNRSLYVEKSARNRSIKYRFLTYIKRVGTEDFQKDIIYKSLATKNRYVKKFIDTALIQKLRLQQITDFHYALIDDQGIFNGFNLTVQPLFKQSQELKSKIASYLHQVINKLQFIPLIYPEKKFKIIWDILASFARLYFLYLIPIQLAWTQQRLLFNTYLQTTVVMLTILLIDFVLSLNTVYYESGQLVINRIKIVKHSLSRAYGAEWLSVFLILILLLIDVKFQIDIDVNKNQFYLILLVFLVHLKSVRDKATQYEMALNLQKITAIYMDLIKFVLLIFYAIHIFSCIWFWASEYSFIYLQDSWLTNDQDTWQNQYLLSFYFACVTMYTIGYGDITPKSNLEKVVAILFIIISSIQLSYSINTVGNIIQKISWYSEEKKNNLSVINQYMSRKKIPFDLQMQIREYLTKYWESKNQEKSQEEGAIIRLLSEDLQQKLMIQSNQAIIKQNQFLFKNISNQCQQVLLKKVNVIHLEPEQLITIQDQLIYVEEGEMELQLPNGPNSYRKKIKQGEFIGLKAFILGEQSNYQYKSQNFSKILSLNRVEFLSTLREFSTDYEHFCQIKDKIVYNYEYHYLGEECSSCHQNSHNIDVCPLLHFYPSKGFLIKRQQFTSYQHRKNFQRKKKQFVRQMNPEQVNQFLIKYEQELKIYNVPNIEKTDFEEFLPLPKFKIQQSISPVQIERQQTHVTHDQFAGIQKQCSLITPTKQVHPQKKRDSIQVPVITVSSYKTQMEASNEILTVSLQEQFNNRVLYLRSLKEEFKDQLLDLELLQKKLQNESQKNYSIQDFDCIYNFTEYYPHNNIDSLLRKSIPSKAKVKRLKVYLTKFIKYLEFPAAFFEQYAHFQSCATDDEIRYSK